jgi:hypothetical protein
MLAIRSATVVFPVPGFPVNDMCSVGAFRRQSHALADALDQKQRRNLADTRLDRLQADQFAVELREDFLDADGFEFIAQVDRIRHGAVSRSIC